jgi:hypothetical protein
MRIMLELRLLWTIKKAGNIVLQKESIVNVLEVHKSPAFDEMDNIVEHFFFCFPYHAKTVFLQLVLNIFLGLSHVKKKGNLEITHLNGYVVIWMMKR